MKHGIWMWSGTLMLGVATAAPAQRPATLDLAPAAYASRARTPVEQAVPIAFWQALGDTTLERLVSEALRSGHDVAVASARVRGARAARTSAALDLAPAITMSGGYTRQQLASPMVPGAAGDLPEQGLWDAGVGFSWEVDVFGRLRRSMQGHGALVDAARADVRDVQVLLAAEVASAYIEVRGAQDRLAVAERNAENQRRTLEVTLQRLEAGRGTALDSERAQAQLSATLAVIPSLEAAIAAARYRIGVLSGRPPGALAADLGATASPMTLPDGLSVENADSLVRRRPDVRSAEQLVDAGAAFVGAARAEYFPRIAIGGAAGYTGTTVRSLGNSGTPRYVVGPVVSWPAFDLGHVRANVDAARARESEARARYELAVARALSEVETSLLSYDKARERLRHLEDAAAASERAAELARLRFEEGASDFLQVLDAERTLLDAQDRRALGRTEAAASLIALYRALGGEWPQ